ncbi:hypothetical protein DIPPA_21625 [Diplonema papillatum]|nr:hypothetical protein DIPPA_25297 [Diplonema papillatum]KAJ9462575.1 hypothetical protein DIPPA_10454 [Diplonema papillatum]KAJ9472853.1 hypothetical protein DIPPA_21625 [Diplonema papillatum]
MPPKDPRSPFARASATGYAQYAVPADVKEAFVEAVGPVLPYRSLSVVKMLAWVTHFFVEVPLSEHLPKARLVLRDLLSVPDSDTAASRFIDEGEDWKLACVMHEAFVANPALFRRVMRQHGLWKGDPPVVDRRAAAGAAAEAANEALPDVTPPDDAFEVPLPEVPALDGDAGELERLRRRVRQLEAPGQRPFDVETLESEPDVRPPAAWRHPSEVSGVAGWLADMRDPAALVQTLHGHFVAGLAHLPGGSILEDAFRALRLWILGCSEVQDWERTALRELGDFLLQQVWVQYFFVKDRLPRGALQQQLRRDDTAGHAVAKAAAAVAKQGGARRDKPFAPAAKFRPRKAGNGVAEKRQ